MSKNRQYGRRQVQRERYHKVHDESYVSQCFDYVWNEYEKARQVLPEWDENYEAREGKYYCYNETFTWKPDVRFLQVRDSNAYLAALSHFNGRGLPFAYFDKVIQRHNVRTFLEELFNINSSGVLSLILDLADLPKQTDPSNKDVVELAHWIYHFRLLIANPHETLCGRSVNNDSCDACTGEFKEKLCARHNKQVNCVWKFTLRPSSGSCGRYGYCRYQWEFEPQDIWKYTLGVHQCPYGYLERVSE